MRKFSAGSLSKSRRGARGCEVAALQRAGVGGKELAGWLRHRLGE